jgi:hypothetical protein
LAPTGGPARRGRLLACCRLDPVRPSASDTQEARMARLRRQEPVFAGQRPPIQRITQSVMLLLVLQIPRFVGSNEARTKPGHDSA